MILMVPLNAVMAMKTKTYQVGGVSVGLRAGPLPEAFPLKCWLPSFCAGCGDLSLARLWESSGALS